MLLCLSSPFTNNIVQQMITYLVLITNNLQQSIALLLATAD